MVFRKRAAHQFQPPNSLFSDGTSRARITVASRMIPVDASLASGWPAGKTPAVRTTLRSHERIDVRHPEHHLSHARTGLESAVRLYDRIGFDDGIDDRP
jgi:hypothetical protein